MTASQNPNLFGELAGLIGTWVGVKGWNVIAMPAPPDSESDACFMVLVQNYYETLSFAPIEDAVLNRGGSLNQIIGAIKYEQSNREFESNELLHAENGVLYYLDDVKRDDATDPNPPHWSPPFKFARSASIPHGNSAMLLGDVKNSAAAEGVELGQQDIPDISTLPSLTPLPDEYLAPYKLAQEKYTTFDIVTQQESKIFNVTNPNDNLRRDNNGLTVLSSTHIHLDSENSGAVVNVPFIAKFAKAVRVRADLWLQKINLPMTSQTYDQLQYSQVIDIEFNQVINGVDRIIRFPHVTTNTLTRKQPAN